MLHSLATLTLTELLRPRSQGEPINRHVLAAVQEPLPDFEAMNRLATNPGRAYESGHEQETHSAAPRSS